MRMRKKKHGTQRLENCAEIIINSKEELLALPVSVEIGCGKGGFICELAKRNPDKNYIAIERVPDVALLAAEKALAAGITNVRFIVGDARILPEFFSKGDVERIYLNFSDPWPKKGHFKRRLTYRAFLDTYKSILCDEGSIIFKTDNRPLFDFSLEEFVFSGFELKGVTYDLHNSKLAENNIVTEYEANFSAKGFSINRVEAFLLKDASVTFRKAEPADLDAACKYFDMAREYMRTHGIDQWQDGYPQRELIAEDIEKGHAWVLTTKGNVVAFACLCFGNEPTYDIIEDGAWPDDLPYAAIHRIVVSPEHKGLGLAGRMVAEFKKICLENEVAVIRGDTHNDNRSMRRMFEKNGFTHCGTIHLANGDPRVAYYQKI